MWHTDGDRVVIASDEELYEAVTLATKRGNGRLVLHADLNEAGGGGGGATVGAASEGLAAAGHGDKGAVAAGAEGDKENASSGYQGGGSVGLAAARIAEKARGHTHGSSSKALSVRSRPWGTAVPTELYACSHLALSGQAVTGASLSEQEKVLGAGAMMGSVLAALVLGAGAMARGR